jgi:hypothetical protein
MAARGWITVLLGACLFWNTGGQARQDGLSNYATPMLCKLLSEMKGGWWRMGLPLWVNRSGDAYEMHVAIRI